MYITKSGKVKVKGAFYFKCNQCDAQWYAERKEVNFTPPCLPYEVYMKCPYCKKNVYKEG